MHKLKHLDRDFDIADGVYIGLIFPGERHWFHFGSWPLQKGTWFVLVMLHNRIYFGAIKAFSCILKHFPFFTWITAIKENSIMYLNLN